MRAEYSVANTYLELSADGETGHLVRIANRLTGDDYLKVELNTPLYKLFCIDRATGSRVEIIPSAPAEVHTETFPDNGSNLSLSFAGGATVSGESADIAATVTVNVSGDDPESRWAIKVSNNDSRYKVTEVLFPYVQGFYLGDSWSDDSIIYPHHAGERTIAPVTEYTSERFKSFWRAGTKQDEQGTYYREINYCGLASMMWMYYYDDANGFHISSYDPDFLVTGLRVETGGPEHPWMGWGMRKYITIDHGACWQSHDYGIAITTEDWHWGARRYRAWFDSVVTIHDNPEYLKDETILSQCYNFKRGGVVYKRFSDIPSMYEEGLADYGMRHMFIASWNRSGFDQDYPEYHPDMDLGSCRQLAQGCEYVNEHNGFVTFYVNSRIFHIKSDYFESLGKKWAMKNYDGTMYHEVYGPHEFVVLCPSDEQWQNRLIDTASWMVESYGASGIYLDQLGSAEPFPCYDPGHTHNDIGQFNQGYMRILRVLHERIQSISPNTFLMIENCGDIYGSYVWGNLTWNGDDYDEFYNVYKYTFPEYAQVHMVNPRRNIDGADRTAKLQNDIARAIALGAVFWVGLDKIPYLTECDHAYLRAAITMRNRIQPLIRDAAFADNDGIADCDPRIQAVRWKLSSGGSLYVVSNPEQVGNAKISVKPEGEIAWFGIDGTEGQPLHRTSAEAVHIDVPASNVSCIVVR